MNKEYEGIAQKIRTEIAKERVEEDILELIAKSNRYVIIISSEMGTNPEEIIRHRDRFIKRKFGV